MLQGDRLGGRAVHQSFLVVLQSRHTSDFGAKQFTCFCTCFQANRRGRGRAGGGAGGRWKLFVGTCFLHVNLKELFLGSLWSEENGTKYFSLEWRKVFCDEICEFKNGILLNFEEDFERNVRSVNMFPACYLSMFWKRNRKSMKSIILRERDDYV